MPKRSAVRLTKRIVEALSADAFAWDAEVPGFGVRSMPSGQKAFIIQYRTKSGRQRRLSIGSFSKWTTEEARAKAKVLFAIVERGGDPADDKRNRREAPTVNDLSVEYLERYARDRDLRDSTIRDAKAVLRLAMPTLGPRKVTEVSVADIRTQHGNARRSSSLYQANRLLAVLSKMFSLAVERGWRTDNPCKGVSKFPEDQRWRNLSEPEVARLLNACDEYENQNGANAVRLLLFTGARLREVLKASWAQFDLEVGLWEKPSTHTKAKRQHRLELDGPALDLLRSMRAGDPLGTYLFPGSEKGKLSAKRPRGDLKRPWAWVTAKANLTDVRLHDLRRTTASFMISDGASLATVGKALGHTQASTTARYAQLSQDVQRNALRAAGDRMRAARAEPVGEVVPLRKAT